MIRRLFYMSLGAAIAVWTMRKLQALTPGSLAQRAADQAVGRARDLRLLAGDVRAAMREHELELREALPSPPTGTSGYPENTETDVKDGR
ncbi:hypothetical protein [Bailinhaonella thermotolerans]|uniref:Secreted protein n=1 Tax=Bailinhaonella thermotolerans TaxID=1070861 RepID=A0A3A4BRL4_9ACTN|nr:hypothetical protein [Bailinhaonella thermotolerans]RJL33966.1 hypothetical protein D5H75_05400 [Bailinhaonella thermotolerans]